MSVRSSKLKQRGSFVSRASDFMSPESQLSHLRWAIAEITIGPDAPSSVLEAVERALAHFAHRSTGLVDLLEIAFPELEDACFAARVGIDDARRQLSGTRTVRTERALGLLSARRRLYRSLVLTAEALSASGAKHAPSGVSVELGSALAVRRMLSDFRGGLVSAGGEDPFRIRWALEVAHSELSIFAAHPSFGELPRAARTSLEELRARIAVWSHGDLNPAVGQVLYERVTRISELFTQLNTCAAVLDHDSQTLAELASLLSNEEAPSMLAARVRDLLPALRGLDPTLDRLEINLIFDAQGTLPVIERRVAELRMRWSAPAVNG
jgi:hypothetical protein